MNSHFLKIKPIYFDDIKIGVKKAEIRKNDRDYAVGDYLHLFEFDKGEYAQNSLVVKVTHITYGGVYGIDVDYIVMSFDRLEKQNTIIDKWFNMLHDAGYDYDGMQKVFSLAQQIFDQNHTAELVKEAEILIGKQ